MTLIGVGWGLSPHASSFKLKFSVSKIANSTEFSSKILLETPGNLLEIVYAYMLDTLVLLSTHLMALNAKFTGDCAAD